MSDLQHYYDKQTGAPVYSLPKADGSGERSVTIRDARKLELAPGVSNVLTMRPEPGLQQYIQWELLKAAWDNTGFQMTPQGITEMAFEEWAKIVRRQSKQHAQQAAERGTEIHRELWASLQGEAAARSVAARSAEQAILARFPPPQEGVKIEHPFVDPLGYGGTVDLWIPSTAIVDPKTTENLAEKTNAQLAWPSHCIQLAAYREGVRDHVECSNLYIDRETGECRWHDWSETQLQAAWEEFKLLLRLWALTKRYDPSDEGMLGVPQELVEVKL